MKNKILLNTAFRETGRFGKVGLLKLMFACFALSMLSLDEADASARISCASIVNEHTVSGVLSDEYKSPLVGVNIYLKGTTIGTTSGESGKFTFPIKLSAGDTLVFSFVGSQTREYVVPQNAPDSIEIQLTMESNILMGELGGSLPVVKENAVDRFWRRMKSIF